MGLGNCYVDVRDDRQNLLGRDGLKELFPEIYTTLHSNRVNISAGKTEAVVESNPKLFQEDYQGTDIVVTPDILPDATPRFCLAQLAPLALRVKAEDDIITCHRSRNTLSVGDTETPEVASPRIVRWRTRLKAYDFAISFRQGNEHSNVDALSRLPLPANEEPPTAIPMFLLSEDTTLVEANQIRRWTPETINSVTGPVTYTARRNNGRLDRRHTSDSRPDTTTDREPLEDSLPETQPDLDPNSPEPAAAYSPAETPPPLPLLRRSSIRLPPDRYCPT